MDLVLLIRHFCDGFRRGMSGWEQHTHTHTRGAARLSPSTLSWQQFENVFIPA